MPKQKPVGHVVMQEMGPDEGFYFPLRLNAYDNTPEDGILEGLIGEDACTFFDTRKDAQAAIARTNNWQKAFDQETVVISLCKIFPVFCGPTKKDGKG